MNTSRSSDEIARAPIHRAARLDRGRSAVVDRLNRLLLGENLWYLPFRFVLLVTVVGIGLAHCLYVLTLANPNLWIALIGVLLTTLIGTVGVCLILFAYWKALTGAKELEPFLLGALALVVAIGFSVEAFAGLTWLLWDHGALGVTASTDLTLWDVEQLFMWNVVDGIPLLDIPRALAWERPTLTSGFWVGVMLVGFRVVVLVPIIGLGALALQASQHAARKALAEFRDEEWNVIKAEQRQMLHSRWDRFIVLITHGASALCVLAVVGAIVAVSFAVRYLITVGVEADSSWLRYWLDAPAHSSFTVPVVDHEVRPLWLLDVGDVVASVAIVALVLIAMYFLALALILPLAVGPGLWRVMAVLAGCSMVLLWCQALAAVAIALVNIGFADPATAIATGDEYRTSVEWFGWHATKLAPLVDIPSTTNWTLSNPYHDRWTGALTVLLRLLMVLIVFWPVGMLVGITVEETKHRSALQAGRARGPS